MLLCELMQFELNDEHPSNASERIRLKVERAKDKTELRTVLAQLVQLTLGGMIRKRDSDGVRQYIEMRLKELDPKDRVANAMGAAAKTIVPAQVHPFGPNQRY